MNHRKLSLLLYWISDTDDRFTGQRLNNRTVVINDEHGIVASSSLCEIFGPFGEQ